MSNEWLLFLFFIFVIVAAVDIVRRVIQADRQSLEEKELQRAMKKLRAPKQPHVTVLVYGRNQGALLEKTVRDVCHSRYAHFDVVAINDRSIDDTERRIAKYTSTIKRRTVVVLNRRVRRSLADTYRAAYRKSKKGEVVLCLRAGDSVDPLLIKRAVVASTKAPLWHVAMQGNDLNRGMLGTMQHLRQALSGHRPTATAYLPSELPHIEGDHSSRWFYRTTLWLLCLLLLLFVAFTNVLALWYIWLLFSGYTLFIYVMTSAHRIDYFAIPSALFVLPVASFIEALSWLVKRK